MEDKKEKLPSTRIQCDSGSNRKLLKITENKCFFTLYRFHK